MEDEFRKRLNPEQYRVMRQKGSEVPFTGKYWDHFKSGVYRCAACRSELFSSKDKFDAKAGFPSFHQPLDEKKLEFKQEGGADEQKVEIRCRTCKSHLGYVVAREGTPYYRLNSTCLDFEEREGWGVADVKDNLEKVQDAKEKIDEVRQQDPEQSEQSAYPAYLQSAALLIGGILVGAGGVAGLVFSGVAPYLCRAPIDATNVSAVATTSAQNPATNSPVVAPPPRTTPVTPAVSPATTSSAAEPSSTPAATTSPATTTPLGGSAAGTN